MAVSLEELQKMLRHLHEDEEDPEVLERLLEMYRRERDKAGEGWKRPHARPLAGPE